MYDKIIKCEQSKQIAPEMTQSLEWIKLKRDIISKVIGYYSKSLFETSATNNLSNEDAYNNAKKAQE